jgi:ABC-type lipoprotein export system ATPase subunit
VALVLENLRFGYPNTSFALAVPGLHIDVGESVALVGPSGSGKTTLLSLIAGILRPDKGTIRLGDAELSRLSKAQRRRHRLHNMGMIFQSFELLDYLNVRDNILLQARLAPGVALTAELRAHAQAIATELGLGDKWQRPITALSQGERQRVAACRALLLDPAVQHLIALCKEHQRILLTVTHDHSLLPGFDRVVDMGQLLGSKAAAE